MYLKEMNGLFCEIEYRTISNNSKLNNLSIITADTINKELQLYELVYIRSDCTEKQFDNLLESIKFIWESEYPDYKIKHSRSESNAFFLKWLNKEDL